VRNSRSRLSKVVDFGTNRKYVCKFLLVSLINSHLGPILPRFRHVSATPTLFHAKFDDVPLGLDC